MRTGRKVAVTGTLLLLVGVCQAAPPALSNFSLLSGPHDLAGAQPIGATDRQVFFNAPQGGVPTLLGYNDVARTWKAWPLPTMDPLGKPVNRPSVRCLCVLPDGKIAFGYGQGITGNAYGYAARLDPATGGVTFSNLRDNWFIPDLRWDATRRRLVALGAGTSWVTPADKGYERVWSSPDGLTYTLLRDGLVPGERKHCFFLSQAEDGRLFTGGEPWGGPLVSADGGATWRSILGGQKGWVNHNLWHTLVLADGTLLIPKALPIAGQTYPLVRGPAGGPYAPSWPAGQGARTIRSLRLLSTGTILAGLDTHGVYASYDHGRSWTSLVPNGLPAGNNRIQATAANVYVQIVGQRGVYVAPVR
jgi:hypothetical protein